MGNRSSKKPVVLPLATKLHLGDIVRIKYPENNVYVWGICTRTDPTPAAVVREEQTPRSGWRIREMDITEDTEYSIDNARDKVSRPKAVNEIVRGARDAIEKGHDSCPWRPGGNNDHSEFVERLRYPKKALDNRLDTDGRSQWHKEEDLTAFFWLLRRGDVVEFKRVGYSHFAICVEEPQFYEECESLVHRTGSDGRSGPGSDIKKLVGRIRRTKFEVGIEGCSFRVNNFCEREFGPRSVEEICDFAIASIGSMAFGHYNLLKNNCWHFVQQARYGKGVRMNVLQCGQWTAYLDEKRLTVGDIVECERPREKNRAEYGCWAIYVGILSPGLGVPEVAYRSRSDNFREKAVIRSASLMEFGNSVAVQGCNFRVNNSWDDKRAPRAEAEIIAFVNKTRGYEYPCKDCGNCGTACPHFVQRARNGIGFRRKLNPFKSFIRKRAANVGLGDFSKVMMP